MALIWAVLVVSAAVVQATSEKDGRYYILVAPEKLRPFSKYEASVTVMGTDKPVSVRVGIVGTEETNKDFVKSIVVDVSPNTKQIASLEIGDIKCCKYNLTVQGDENFKFENQTGLEFHEKYQSIFIQTDRAMYKPGHKVQFRVLVLNSLLAPSSQNKIDVLLKDGQNNRVKEWKKVEAVKGVYSNDIQLSSQPVLGEWTIVVKSGGKETTKTFTVAEYVLPKFEVKVDLPKYATISNSKIPVEVSAKYTYGQLVKGEATIKTKLEWYGYNQQPKENSKLIKVDPVGRTEIDVVESLGIKDLSWDTQVTFDVQFKEELTGKVLNGSGSITLHKNEFQMFFERVSDNLVPGEEYKTKLKVVNWDNTPYVGPKGEKVKVRQGERTWSAMEKNNVTWDNEYDLPKTGELELSFPTDENTTSLSIEAEYMGQNTWTYGFKPYETPVEEKKNVSLEITLKDEKRKIGDRLPVDIAVKGSPKYISYYVIGRELIDTDTIKLEEGQNALHLDLMVTQSMSPSAHLLVSFISDDGEVFAEEKYIHVENFTENFVKINAMPDDTEPGKKTTITVETKPNSLVGLMGVDQSVLLLKKGNDLSENDIKYDLNSYENGPYNRYRRSFVPYWRRSSTKWIFNSAGAAVLTNAHMYEEPFNLPVPLQSPLGPAFPVADGNSMVALAGAAKPQAGTLRRLVSPQSSPFGTRKSSGGSGSHHNARINRPVRLPILLRSEFPETWIWNLIDSSWKNTESEVQKLKPLASKLAIMIGYLLIGYF